MSYREFDINSAINPVVSRKSYRIEGVSDVSKIYASRSASTEEFVSGAIHDLGVVNRNVMYVHSSLSGLRDRLAIANVIAKNVAAGKARGMEGFSNVRKMDPWEYALEDSNQNFFQKVWQAIRSACSRLITAIVNIIKHIQVFIANADAKKAAADYAYFVKNKSLIEKNNKSALKTELNSMDWQSANVISSKIETVAGKYINAFKGIFGTSGDGGVLEKAASFDMSQAKSMSDFKKIAGSIFRFKWSDEAGAGALRNAAEKYTDNINEPIWEIVRDSGVKAKKEGDLPSATETARAFLVKSKEVGKKTVQDIKNLSGDFAVLKTEWLSKNVTKHVTALNNAVKEFTKYTKTVDKLSAQFKKVVDAENATTVKSLSAACSKLSNDRIKANGWMTTLMLELELMAIRFRKTAHTALRVYMRGGATKEKTKKESKEIYSSLFLL